MISYFFPFLAFLLFRWGVNGQRNLINKTYYILLVSMFVFSAFRFVVGCDWTGYLNHFNIVSNSFYSPIYSPRDLGWWLLLDGIEEVGLPYPSINIAVGLIFFACMHAIARRQPDPMLFLLALFPVLIGGMAMASMRQQQSKDKI